MQASDPILERRSRHDLRAVFFEACAALEPFFDPVNQWAGMTHEHLALRTLKERFPQLDTHESFLVVTTVKRLVASGNYTPK